MVLAFLILAIVLVAVFTFLNGFRDVSAAVALAVRTNALTPSIAVLLAAMFNALGVLISVPFALAISQSWVVLPPGLNGVTVAVSTLASAILWNVFTWWRGIPSSSTHAIVGGLTGAALASTLLGGGVVADVGQSLWVLVLAPLLLSPIVAFAGAYLLVVPVTWVVRHMQPSVVNRRLRHAQAVSAAAVAFGHGLQDGQRGIALSVLTLIAADALPANGSSPVWVIVLVLVCMALGTLGGGWRISHTLGHRLVRIDPLRGFVAHLLSAVMLFVGAIGLHLPFSTTHTVTAATLGAGTNQSFSTTNRSLVIRVLGYWLLTPVMCALLAFVLQLAQSPLYR
ncbi:inorganic phosphate transporter [Pseudarthrobacter sp. J1738]|uniref:inorganic phosphate transporter n=1 Tax=Pseudarthrobacter sp. J1738 TaxID=3420446 RepID=UPI003D2ABDFB